MPPGAAGEIALNTPVEIVVFGFAWMARDGLLAGLAILLSLGVVAMVVYQFL